MEERHQDLKSAAPGASSRAVLSAGLFPFLVQTQSQQAQRCLHPCELRVERKEQKSIASHLLLVPDVTPCVLRAWRKATLSSKDASSLIPIPIRLGIGLVSSQCKLSRGLGCCSFPLCYI